MSERSAPAAWQPPERPDWVAAINRGDHPLFEREARLPFDRDALLAEVRTLAGLPNQGVAPFGGPEFPAEEMIDALDRVLGPLDDEAELTRLGRWMTRRFLLRLLQGRLQLMEALRRDPGIRDEEIEAPLVVAGAPRTGTTILFALLAADPASRVPLGWELLRPLPSVDPERATEAGDPRIELADRELVLPQTVVSGLAPIHSYGALQPKECLSAMSFAFRSEEFTARYHVPSYEGWLFQADMEPAYRMHRLVLQVLQRGATAQTRRRRWVLKSPVHLHSLGALLATYPDARIAITHRDPQSVLASMTSLIATLRYAHSDRVDVHQLGLAHATRWRSTFDRLVESWRDGTLPQASVHHSRFADFLRDPIEVVEGLYEHFGLPLGDPARKAIEATREAKRGGGPGGHEYRFEMLGLDRQSVRTHFSAYREEFGVPEESG